MAEMSLSDTLKKIVAAYSALKTIGFNIDAAVKNTMNYTAVYNSYAASFQRMASDWSKDWEKYGFEGAAAYGNSFIERMNASIAELSGIQVDGAEGLLTEAGIKNLGLNIREVTQYASQLASTANSIGLTGEVSLAAAQSFTRLAGDMASLFQVDYGTAAGNLQAGLLGQSEALNQYGINLGEAALQAYAYELGLEKTVDEMTQMESMQLRMLAILDQSQMSWGNLADTINLPSNLMRQFTNNMEETGMVLGQLFIPMLQSILPVVNGVTIAIKQLLINIAGLMGVNLDFGNFGQVDSGYGEHLKEVSGGLNNVASSAKKAKAGLRAFDELKVINMTGTSTGVASGGTGGSIDLTNQILTAAKEYEKVWNDAYAAMESRAQEFADKISKFLEPIQTIFEDLMIGDFFKAGQDVSGLVAGIFYFFAEAIDKVDWYGIGQKMGDFLAGIDWIAVLKSIGAVIWQGMKASLELFAGMFDAAPVETYLLSVLAISKALDLLKASKLGTLATNIGLVVSALSGNQDANVALSKSYPKLKAAVDIAKKAFANFRFGIENGNFLTGLNAGIDTVRNNLTGMQKGIIGVAAVFGEFALLKSAFYDIASGADNLVASIGKIVIGAGAASAALYVAFGPAGLVAAGITALVAGIVGIDQAMREINAETVGNTIKNALTTPGGMTMDEISSSFTEKMANIASSFDDVSAHSQALETAQNNIRNTYTEISAIQSAMDQGALSVEKGVERINASFDRMSTEFSIAVSELEQSIIGALGEGSILRQYLAAMGYDVDALNGMVVGDISNIQSKFNELLAEYEEIQDSTNPEDIARKKEILASLAEIAGVTNDATQNMIALQTASNNMHLNMGSVIDTNDLENLSFAKEEFGNSLQSMMDVYNSTNKAISEGNVEFQNNLATLNSMLEAAGIEENTAKYNEIISAIPTATLMSHKDLNKAFTDIINTLQEDALGEIPSLMKQAAEEWDNLSAEAKLNLSYQGIGNKDQYMEYVLESYKTDVLAPMEEELNKALEGLEIDSEVVMVQKAQEVYNAIFYYDDSEWYAHEALKLRENWEQILGEVDFSSTAQEYGKYAAEGYAEGFRANKDIAATAAEQLGQEAMQAVKDAQDSNSPSKVMWGFGKDAVDGYNLGISENAQTTIDTVKSFMDSISNQFDDIIGIFTEIGSLAMNGLFNGMSSMEDSLYEKTRGIADNIAKTIKTTLDIHSPSRVMFRLGDFVMQGFKKGIENLYKPILSSIKEFGLDLQVAPYSSIAGMYQDYQQCDYDTSYMSTHESVTSYHNSYNQNNTEIIYLLKELISAVKSGHSIEIDGQPIAKVVQKSFNEYHSKTGRPAINI